jgi:hypothetical protein
MTASRQATGEDHSDPVREEERRLWDELNQRLIDSVPKGTMARDAPWEMSVALSKDPELGDLFRRVMEYSVHDSGYIHERLEDVDDDGPEIGDLFGLPKSLDED